MDWKLDPSAEPQSWRERLGFGIALIVAVGCAYLFAVAILSLE